jgi:hypothetical protein
MVSSKGGDRHLAQSLAAHSIANLASETARATAIAPSGPRSPATRYSFRNTNC